MKISCPTCAAKYSVADEKIQARLAKIRCRKCSSTIVIDGTASPANVYIGEGSSSPASTSTPPQDLAGAELAPSSGRSAAFSDRAASEPVGPAADEYAVDIADNDQRNMTIHQIVGAYNEGLITADTYIWKEGMADWQTLAEVRDVAEALHAAARPLGATPAAVRRPGPATDLFGSIDTAGGENDITTSAPQAAPMMTAGTGARNESSVLFSLSALTSTPDAAPSPTSPKRSRASADDSGLIDLQALTSAEAAAGGGAYAAPIGAFGASPLISAPLGGVSGPAMGAALTAGYGRRSNNRSLLIAAALLAVGIIGAAAVVVKRGGGDDSEPTSALDKAPAAAAERGTTVDEPKNPSSDEVEPIAEATELPAKEPAIKDSVAADELPAAAEPTPARATHQARTSTPRPRVPARAKPQPAAAPAPEPTPAATPKPAASSSDADSDESKKKKKPVARCECKPADLMCAMRCSAKK